MKTRMNLMLVAMAVMLIAIVWIVARGQKTMIVNAAPQVAAAPAVAAVEPESRIQVQAPVVSQLPAAPTQTVAAPIPATAPQAQADASKGANWGTGEKLGYTAVEGDTLSNVATGLLGSDTKQNRDTVTAANPSLAADPDRVVTGKTYLLTPPAAIVVATISPEPQVASVPTTQPDVSDATTPKSDRVLKYTAQPGDSVSALAAGLLGADSKTNRDAIISHNQSLQNDPDHVEAGKTYKIPTSTGLSAAPAPVVANAPAPTTQPDADGVVKIGTGRELRYTARAGDTVSKLAEVLLGSDTQANRDAIVNNNASLKSDPDRVVAGQTYWIPAPVASAQ